MLCTDVLSLIPPLVQDWPTLAIMSTVCRDWKQAVEKYAGPNHKMDRGKFKGLHLYRIMPVHPSYLEYMHGTCKLPYLFKIMDTQQPRADLRYLKMSFGKYKGRLVRGIPRDYMSWLSDNCDDLNVLAALNQRRRRFQH